MITVLELLQSIKKIWSNWFAWQLSNADNEGAISKHPETIKIVYKQFNKLWKCWKQVNVNLLSSIYKQVWNWKPEIDCFCRLVPPCVLQCSDWLVVIDSNHLGFQSQGRVVTTSQSQHSRAGQHGTTQKVAAYLSFAEENISTLFLSLSRRSSGMLWRNSVNLNLLTC